MPKGSSSRWFYISIRWWPRLIITLRLLNFFHVTLFLLAYNSFSDLIGWVLYRILQWDAPDFSYTWTRLIFFWKRPQKQSAVYTTYQDMYTTCYEYNLHRSYWTSANPSNLRIDIDVFFFCQQNEVLSIQPSPLRAFPSFYSTLK